MIERLKDDSIVVLTLDDAREQGFDVSGVIVHSLPLMEIKLTEPIPYFKEKRKGHIRSYKYHR